MSALTPTPEGRAAPRPCCGFVVGGLDSGGSNGSQRAAHEVSLDLRSGAKERRSRREAQRSTFARFFGLFDFRLLQQNLPKPGSRVPYSITSSARPSSESGKVRPSVSTKEAA